MTPSQIRQHLLEVEAAFLEATRDGTLNEVLIRDYIRASADVEALDANEKEMSHG